MEIHYIRQGNVYTLRSQGGSAHQAPSYAVRSPTPDCPPGPVNRRGGVVFGTRGGTTVASLADVTDKVYPRVCGGTRYSLGWSAPGMGLSPRVRGNRCPRRRRSIPGVRGNPIQPGYRMGLSPRVRGNPQPREVYPRVCGGTGSLLSMKVYPRVCGGTPPFGASVYPRVCGGTTQPSANRPSLRSIPACAGEPAGKAAS